MDTSPYLQRPLRSLEAYQRELASRVPVRPACAERAQEMTRPRPEPAAHEQGSLDARLEALESLQAPAQRLEWKKVHGTPVYHCIDRGLLPRTIAYQSPSQLRRSPSDGSRT